MQQVRKQLLRFLNIWPPFLGAGIKVLRISPDKREVDVEMRLRFWNKNYVGTHFGGSLYAMVDPFFMLIVMENLGPEFIVWDKAATIRFKRPGRGTVRAEFRVSQERIEALRDELASKAKIEPVFQVEIKDQQGMVVAEIEKLLYIRRKDSLPSARTS